MKKRQSVTQKQIAKQAGVSQTLVSLALNGSYDVTLSGETRQKVLDVAYELGYVPQAAAKSLVKGHSTNIGLILIRPHQHVFRDPFIPNIITGLSGVVRSHNFRLLVEYIDDLNQLHIISHMLKGGEVAGILVSSFEGLEDIVSPLIEDGYPIVSLDSSSAKYYTVTINHPTGVASAAHHLVSLGHRHIGCIAFGPPSAHLSMRINAFCNVLQSNGLDLDEKYIRYGEYDPQSGYEAMKSLLSETPQLTAVFGMNDIMAIGALRAILDAGLRVPEDIAVVGYDDMRFSAFTNPALTTVRCPEIELGQVAGEMLIQLIDGYIPPEPQISLPTELIIRTSCPSSSNN